jgi:hypothetical protein
VPVPLDDFPLHQAPLSLAQVATSDRNFYDRYYFCAHDRTGDIFVVTGFGTYPNLGVNDAFAVVRRGDHQQSVRCSDPISDDRLHPRVGPYRVEVVEPLQRIRLVCDAVDHGMAFDLTWEGSFPAVDEQRHLMRSGARTTLDSWRFAQVGTWSGTLSVGGHDLSVDPDRWVGSRDRSWGIRPVGEPEPPGRPALVEGFWWLYVPLRFDDFAVVVIVQEQPDGYRTLNDAVRLWPDGRLEQLGWPRVEIRYRPGTRLPEAATIALTDIEGKPLTLAVETRTHIALHVGAGYGNDPDWSHGQWRGEGFVEAASYDLNNPEIAARVPWGVVDHAARATLDGAEGWGLFEHASIGRHDPTGFHGYEDVAPPDPRSPSTGSG